MRRYFLTLLCFLAAAPGAFADAGCFDLSKAGVTLDANGIPSPGFQAPLDGRKPFDLEVHEVALDPSQPSAPPRLYYFAFRHVGSARQLVAINPTILTQAGGNLAYTLRNCIHAGAEVKAIQDFLATSNSSPSTVGAPAAVPADAAGSVGYVYADHPVPMGKTNVHTHGLHAPPTVGSKTVPSGDEVLQTELDEVGAAHPGVFGNSVQYVIKTPANQHAGLYWYHPHFHGEAQQQVYLGLTGAIVVLPRGATGADYTREMQEETSAHTVLVARDWPLSADVKLKDIPFARKKAPPCDVVPAGICALATPDTGANEAQLSPKTRLTLNGSPIDPYTLPNGTSQPAVPLTLTADSTRLWRVLNSSANTFMAIGLSTTPVPTGGIPANLFNMPMKIVGRDGESASRSKSTDASVLQTANPDGTYRPVLLPPGGRLEFQIPASSASKGTLYLLTGKVYTGRDGDEVPWRTLAQMNPVQASPAALVPAVALQRAEASPSTRFTCPATMGSITKRELVFLEANDPQNASRLTNFYVKALTPSVTQIAPFDMAHLSPAQVEVVLNSTSAPTYEQWTIYNYTGELHAFHIHQLHFCVQEYDAPDPPLHVAGTDWTPALENDSRLNGPLDVINVPFARPGPDGKPLPGKVVLLIPFSPDIRGEFVFHCHLLEHEDGGMMGTVRVRFKNEPASVGAMAMPGHTMSTP